MMTAATSPASAATMSVSSTDRKFEAKNWATAKVAPTARAIGQVWRAPRLPSTMMTSSSGTNSASSGVWRPT